jgi:hypothetical protein
MVARPSPLPSRWCRSTTCCARPPASTARWTIRDGFGVGGLKVAAAPASKVDTGRTVRVEFTGTVMPGLPWDMRPLTISLDIHPGELQQVSYLVRNTSDRTITGQAVPSVTPGQAAQHFEKIECFCFSQQTLGPANRAKCRSLLSSNQRSTVASATSPCPMPFSASKDNARL